MKATKVFCALLIGMMIASGMPFFAAAQTSGTQDTLVIALQDDMQNMNPWDPDTNAVWKSYQIGWNFEGLMAYNPDFELYPVLAAKDATGANGADVFIDATGLNITLNLRQDVTFTDGTPMDSQDVVFSYQTLGWGLFQTSVLDSLYWDDGTTFTAFDGGVSHIGVEANGTYAVDFHLPGPYAMFWYSTLTLPIMPYHVWQSHLMNLDPADYPGYNVTGERGWDYSYGTDPTETDATIGTGPMYLESWTKEQGSVIKAYDNYWGKNETTTWQGKEYPNFPNYVKTIRFKIYTQLDVAILALQNGDVHHLPWSLTPGYYNQLKTDPNIGIEQTKDQGFFYLTFNMRHGPMSDVNFRRAVAYCVDKQYIVDRLMSGYGIQGSVPISVTNTLYVNTSVPAWIQGGDLNAAAALLDANGYTDKDGDGWRDMPDGSPIKLNILTPPKDYDPIRADSGIMIEKNLKSIGLNIASVPTSFDTIVSAGFVSLDFDMFILGWSVGSFPEDYLKDFFHSDMDVAVNPSGSNAEGYHNASVDTMIDAMATEMDNAKRVQYVKDICGATMMDVAYDALYYRTNIEAYRQDIWQGWIPAFGTIYNGFSIYNLAPPTEGGGGGNEGSGSSATLSGIEASINMPSMAGAGQTVSGTVVAVDVLDDQTTQPSVGASVRIETSFGQYVNTTTGANGTASFTLNVPWQRIQDFRVDANVSRSGAWTNINKTVGVKFTNYIASLSLSTDDGVVEPGATTDVVATVTDANGGPLVGVDVTVDTALMFGTVDAATKTTGADGTATFTYTAPPASMLPNTHRYEQFKASISVNNTIVPEIQSSSLTIGISNDVFDWHDLDITNVTAYVLDNDNATAFADNTTITLELTDQDGTAVAGYDVNLNLSADGSVIDADAMTKQTNATGMVSFNLTVDPAYTGAGTVVATFSTEKAYSIKDSVAIYIRNNPTFTQDMYHLNVTDVSNDEITNTNSSATNTTTIDVRLFNDTWAPVSGMDVYMALSNDSLVTTSGASNTTDAFGNATFNITCVANGSVDLGIGFGIMGGIGIFEGYNLKVNKTPATIPATQAVSNETVYGPATGGETGLIGNLSNTPIVNATIYTYNAGTWTKLTEPADYTLNTTTGSLNLTIALGAGDNVSAFYNYTYYLAHHHLTAVADTNIIDNNGYANATPGTSHITVTLADTDGNPIAGADVYAYTMLSDGLITLDKAFNTTDASGNVQFNATSVSNNAGCVGVYFRVNDTAGVSEDVLLYNAPYVPGYAADINFTGVAEHNSAMSISAIVYDAAGDPAPGVPCQFFIPPTSEGIPGVFQGGDGWYWEEYDSSWDMGTWAGYLGSWYGNNTMLGVTTTDANGHFDATIHTPSFTADSEIPLQFGVGGTGVTAGFNYSANNWWMEYYPAYAPPLSDNDAVYYWEEAGFTMVDQAILKRAPIATLTSVSMDQPILSAADNTTIISLSFQDLAGDLATTSVNIGEGTAKPTILDEGTTSAAGVYSYNYTYVTDSPDFDAGIGFTSMVTDADYAQFPFNFYLPYLATGTDAQTLVVNVEPADYVVDIGDNITLDVTVTDEYGRVMSGVALDATNATATTDANGTARLTVPTANLTDAGLYTMALDATRGTLSTSEDASVILQTVAEGPVMVDIVVGPVQDADGNPIVGATVNMTIDGITYTGVTNSTGYAVISVPDTALGQEASITISKDGYDPISYTTTLNSDGTLASAPPAMTAAEGGGGGSNMMLIAAIVIVVVVILALLMLSKMGGAKPAAAPAPEEEPVEEMPPAEEPTASEGASAPETVEEASAPEQGTPADVQSSAPEENPPAE